MFIVSLQYIRPIEEIDANLEAHVAYLREEYAKGSFIASGRKTPRTGGVILSTIGSRDELESILARDPFNKAGVAEYAIIEFTPTMVAEGFVNLQE
ncbi:YciI family protein [Oceanidesulfovibrio marinus]|uniref:YCII-related domain-containing protein n=1 Tax=Oceanidesulfovibrio marinus TaxID=370038 RepID=A0A6P1ZI84_9BACT|nr:YciI family protein [Oceanidesulfovibrio marinus]TVM33039.1 hypothetical protein DQK91_12805 [Oceanidesulfovibrio marinus]